MKTIHIDVYSDVVCPWCFLGKRRLEQAMQSLKDRYQFKTRFLPFELNPEMPKQGVDRKAYLSQKFGNSDALDAAHARLKSLGEEAGIEYNFEAAQKACNTFDAHRVLWLAGKQGLQAEVKEALMKAYFTDGEDVGDKQTLVRIAAAAGLQAEQVRQLLDGKEGGEEVREEEARAYTLGVQGVPFFVFENHYAVSGAQSPQTLEQVIEKAAAEPAGRGS